MGKKAAMRRRTKITIHFIGRMDLPIELIPIHQIVNQPQLCLIAEFVCQAGQYYHRVIAGIQGLGSYRSHIRCLAGLHMADYKPSAGELFLCRVAH